MRHFGSWRAAKEALELSAATTPRKIEPRFRARLVGKVHRYREDWLRETLEKCVADLGRVPLVIEFEHWRQREIDLAKAQGKELFLPSDSPYRRRWGTWENALLHFGYEPEEVLARLKRAGSGRTSPAPVPVPRTRLISRDRPAAECGCGTFTSDAELAGPTPAASDSRDRRSARSPGYDAGRARGDR